MSAQKKRGKCGARAAGGVHRGVSLSQTSRTHRFSFCSCARRAMIYIVYVGVALVRGDIFLLNQHFALTGGWAHL